MQDQEAEMLSKRKVYARAFARVQTFDRPSRPCRGIATPQQKAGSIHHRNSRSARATEPSKHGTLDNSCISPCRIFPTITIFLPHLVSSSGPSSFRSAFIILVTPSAPLRCVVSAGRTSLMNPEEITVLLERNVGGAYYLPYQSGRGAPQIRN